MQSINLKNQIAQMTNTATIAIAMKIAEMQTSPMLASGAHLLGCGILALNITK